MKRRSFIIASVLGLFGVSVFSFLRWGRSSDQHEVLAQPRFLSLLCDDETIRMLGRSYLKMKPTERGDHILLNELMIENLPQKMASDRQAEAIIEIQMEKRIVHDFDTDNVVMVQGWVLSVTEARQCAFFSILND